jgi:hypothetical protein
MPEPKKKPVEHQPHGRRDRDSANDRPHKRGEYTAGADGDRDVDASAAEEAETFKPDKNGWGGCVRERQAVACPSTVQYYLTCLLKKATVRSHDSLADAASYRGVVSLLKPCCVPA